MHIPERAARFIEKRTGRAAWVFNTHFDHVSQPSRLTSDNRDGRHPSDHYPVYAEIALPE
ncbi:MAG: hypothetical protein WD795_14380 [Woeseia sp.]